MEELSRQGWRRTTRKLKAMYKEPRITALTAGWGIIVRE